MNKHHFSALLAAPALMLTLTAHAHDPKEHMKEAKNPDCSAMNRMDHSKMNLNDPVMQAMMQKCMKEMHIEAESPVKGHGGHAGHDDQKEVGVPQANEQKK